MRDQNRNITKAMASNIGIRIPFSDSEAVEFNQYVEEHFIKKGPFIRSLVLKAIREDKKNDQ